MGDAYRPPPGGTYETVGVPPPITSSFKGAASGKAGANDEVGTTVIVTTLVVEWGSRMFNNRKARRDGK
ncbi:hypothetical protein LX16_5343 [Stackebrandtia albiflava]|uniref:Uncharacterized protein n=1 Tax=Stackebrandtia albiflava TaxID=406432 RepID=A0A562UL97_9ACTN|nr:hypothetical protein [Stackebrandtia albiflava]TWJ06379.1 hypothetical protein LX16_5343 [Stackebrandtia albiflava]